MILTPFLLPQEPLRPEQDMQPNNIPRDFLGLQEKCFTSCGLSISNIFYENQLPERKRRILFQAWERRRKQRLVTPLMCSNAIGVIISAARYPMLPQLVSRMESCWKVSQQNSALQVYKSGISGTLFDQHVLLMTTLKGFYFQPQHLLNIEMLFFSYSYVSVRSLNEIPVPFPNTQSSKFN